MAVMEEIELSTPTSYLFPIAYGPISSRLAVNKLLPVLESGSHISEAKLTFKLRRNESTERTKLVRPPVELNYRSDGR